MLLRIWGIMTRNIVPMTGLLLCFAFSLGGCASGARMVSEDGGVVMDVGMPDASDAGVIMPDAIVPDASSPDGSSPDASLPDATVPDATVPDASAPDAAPGPTGEGLYVSEYIEGGAGRGASKALEMHYGGMGILNLSLCQVVRYTNGATMPSARVSLMGTLASGGTFVLCGATFGQAFCDQSSGSITHNGDDAYELVCSGRVVDSFGRVGEDPGVAWSDAAGTLSTRDTVLRRKCSVTMGDTNSGDDFDPAVEWVAVSDTDLSGFGIRGC